MVNISRTLRTASPSREDSLWIFSPPNANRKIQGDSLGHKSIVGKPHKEAKSLFERDAISPGQHHAAALAFYKKSDGSTTYVRDHLHT